MQGNMETNHYPREVFVLVEKDGSSVVHSKSCDKCCGGR